MIGESDLVDGVQSTGVGRGGERVCVLLLKSSLIVHTQLLRESSPPACLPPCLPSPLCVESAAVHG